MQAAPTTNGRKHTMNTGSLVNMIADQSNAQATPAVGDGATVIMWSDRIACTITDVSKSGATIQLQADTATRTDDLGMSDAQSYDYTRDPNGSTYTARRSRTGVYRVSGLGARVIVGVRNHHHDYSF